MNEMVSKNTWSRRLRQPDVKALVLVVMGVVVVAILLRTNVIAVSNKKQLADVLATVVAIAGVALSVIIGFIIETYYRSRERIVELYGELTELQTMLDLFRELCYRSYNYHEIWNGLAAPPS
ncbi:MAG TPA: hypothetical protein PKM88_04565, partial [bacterium]|nr:hypothetical protein [bacterium]